MKDLAVGQPAPPFRLPSGQGGEVALTDYRGRRKIVLWFTSGMACSFCRQQMFQLARLGPEIEARQAEVLEVTPTPAGRAQFYAKNFRLPFPYLSDPEHRVHEAYGLAVRSHSPAWYALGLYAALKTPEPPSDFGKVKPTLREFRRLLHDNDMGLFVVDRQGIVRFVHAGTYMLHGEDGRLTTPAAARPLPRREDLLQAIERCQ